MKNSLLLLCCILASYTLRAQTDSSGISKADSPKIIDTTSMAKVYVIRSTGHVASAVNLRVTVDSVTLCKVRNNHYAAFFVQPGTHSFSASSWDQSASKAAKFALKVPVEAGKSYYMSIQIKQRFMGIEIYMEEITYNTAGPLLLKYKQDECD